MISFQRYRLLTEDHGSCGTVIRAASHSRWVAQGDGAFIVGETDLCGGDSQRVHMDRPWHLGQLARRWEDGVLAVVLAVWQELRSSELLVDTSRVVAQLSSSSLSCTYASTL